MNLTALLADIDQDKAMADHHLTQIVSEVAGFTDDDPARSMASVLTSMIAINMVSHHHLELLAAAAILRLAQETKA